MDYFSLDNLLTESQTRVGKRPGNGVYVQYDAIRMGESDLNDNELKLVHKASKFLPKGFNFDFIWTDGKKYVRFIELSSLSEAHPHAVNALIYDDSIVDFKPGKTNDQIFHRMETMISPSHQSYGFHRRVTDYESRMGLLGKDQPKGIGWGKVWKKWVEEHDITYEDYLEELESLR